MFYYLKIIFNVKIINSHENEMKLMLMASTWWCVFSCFTIISCYIIIPCWYLLSLMLMIVFLIIHKLLFLWITHLFSYKIFEFESLFTVIYLMFVIQLNFGFHLFVFILDVINVKCSLWNIVHDGHRFMMNTLFHDENIICLTKIQPEACEIFFFLLFFILLSYFW